MIHYPILTLVESGITDIMLVTNPRFFQQYIDLLGDGRELGCNLIYGCQIDAGGIAQAMLVAESFIGNDDVCFILGDNIFQDSINQSTSIFKTSRMSSHSHCHIVCKSVPDASNYGVLQTTEDGKHIIVEKPENPTSDLCVTGLYYYSSDVFNNIRTLTPSTRGELEVTDLNNMYISAGNFSYSTIYNKWWDTGVSVEHLMDVSSQIKQIKQGKR
jgi:glucose-1-phosphate thymidylyltransferase